MCAIYYAPTSKLFVCQDTGHNKVSCYSLTAGGAVWTKEGVSSSFNHFKYPCSLVGTKIYFFSDILIETFDVTAATWAVLDPSPNPTGPNACSVVIGTDIYLLGGSYNQPAAQKLDTGTNTWTPLPNLPAPGLNTIGKASRQIKLF